MRRLLPLAAFVCLLLSGCSGNAPSSHEHSATSMSANDAHGGHDPAMHIVAPTWNLGDWWSVTSPQIETPYTMAISGEQGNDWIIDTDNLDIAFFDARTDISTLGKAAKADLAGSQGEQRVQFFDFPLFADKSWTTTWDGKATNLKVTKVDNGVATIEATQSGKPYATYTYDSKMRYFGRIAFLAPDGSTAFESKTTQYGTNFTGQLVRWTLKAVVDRHGHLTGESQTFTVPATITDVYIAAHAQCTTGAVAIALGPPTGPTDNRGYSVVSNCPVNDTSAYVAAVAPAQDETWGYFFTAESPDASLDITVWLRTVTTFAVGAAPK
jgi:hypothetical protein